MRWSTRAIMPPCARRWTRRSPDSVSVSSCAIRRADGELRFCSLTLTPIGDGDDVTGALGVVRDVTDERRLAEQLMQQEKLAAVGQLVSGVAHELNNPLASVMAFAQLLLAAPEGRGAGPPVGRRDPSGSETRREDRLELAHVRAAAPAGAPRHRSESRRRGHAGAPALRAAHRERRDRGAPGSRTCR